MPALLRDLGRVEEASRYVDQALEIHAANVVSLKVLADDRSQRRLVMGREGARTRELIENAMRLASDSPEVFDSLSWFHLCRGEWRQGVEVLRRFAHRHPRSPQAWRYYAGAASRTGDLQVAAEATRRVLSLDPDSWRANLLACDILAWQPPSQEFRQLLENMLVKFPERWTIWARVGLAVITTFKDADRACAISSEAPRLQPQLFPAWFQHGRVLALAHRYQEAIVAAEVGWRWLPKDEDGSFSIPAAFGVAQNYMFVNVPDRSEPWIQEATLRLPALISLDPAKGYFWQGQLLELSRDEPGALAAYRKSVEHHLFFPKRREAETALLRLTTRAGKIRGRAFPIR
jgi:tetratricopeptide (TPR) repeat protein